MAEFGGGWLARSIIAGLVVTFSPVGALPAVLKGTVTDSQDHPVWGAVVEILDRVTKAALRTTTTDSDGVFQFADLKAGSCNLVARKPGFAYVWLRDVTVPQGGFVEVVVPMRGVVPADRPPESVTLNASAYAIAMTPLDARWAALDRSCRTGQTESCLQLAGLHLVARRDGLALGTYRTACDLGDGMACAELANRNWAFGVGSAAAIKYQQRTLELLQQACDKGDAGRCAALAANTSDETQSNKLWIKACDGGSAAACFHLADGAEGSPRETVLKARARKLAEEGCKQDHARDCFLAATVHLGEGSSEADRKRAAALFKKACGLGLPEACEMSGQE